MKFSINNRWTDEVQYECELDASFDTQSKYFQLGAAVKLACNGGADLRGADLGGADLRDAVLRGAVLKDAVLRGADLRGADLRDADLRGAVLRDADLRGADLRDAVLRGAVLRGAVLRDADLRDAGLGGAVLRGAVLWERKVHSLRVFTGLYEYQVWAVLFEDGSRWIRMGCFFRSVEEWEEIGIRKSNLNEFPDDGSECSEERAIAYEFAKAAVLRMELPEKEPAK